MDQSPLHNPQQTLEAKHIHCSVLTKPLPQHKNNYHIINFKHNKIQLELVV